MTSLEDDSSSPPKSSKQPATPLLWSSLSMSLQHQSSSTTPAPTPQSKAPLPTSSSSTKADSLGSIRSSPPPAYTSQSGSPAADRPTSSDGYCTQTKTWRFEFAVEGVSNDACRPDGIVGYFNALISIIVGTIMGIGGLIVSVTVVLASTVFPSMQSKLPESKPVERVPSSSRRSSPVHSSSRSQSGDSESRSPSTSPKIDATTASERRVTFKITKPVLETMPTGSSGAISINTPTVPQFAPEEKESSSRPCLGRKDSVASTSTSTSSRSFMSKLIRRRAPSQSQSDAVIESENEGSVSAYAGGGSAPSTPAKSEVELPADPTSPETTTTSKRPRKISLKLQLRGAFKRRSTQTTPVSTPGILVASPDSQSTGGSINVFPDTTSAGDVQVQTPSSIASALPSPPIQKSKRTKTFPFQHAAPSTAPIQRTNPYGYPHYAPLPVARSRRNSEDATPAAVTPKKQTTKEERRRTLDSVSGLGLDTGAGVVDELGVLATSSSGSGKRVVSESSVSPTSSKKKRTTPLRSSSKPPTTGPTSPLSLDRHARSAMVMASYSDTEGPGPRRARI